MGLGKKGREFDIVRNFRGAAKSGEMVLVLGGPGSGCTTLLKVPASQRIGYTKIDGEVLYGNSGRMLLQRGLGVKRCIMQKVS